MIEPLIFGNPATPLFGVLNRPQSTPAVDRGVVICAPLGYENVIYYRQLAILARRLAQAGRPTLRFDWPGCGDSAGDDRQPNLVAAYLESVRLAVDVLRTHTGVDHVDLIGLRVGATLAAAGTSLGAESADLVLWDPFTTGRGYIRAMRAFDRLVYKPVEEDDNPLSSDGQPASGFVIAPSTIEDLSSLDLTEIEYGPPRRVLLAGRDAPPDEVLDHHFRSLGHNVSATVFEGLREVALGWTERPVPTASFAAIEAWLAPGRPQQLPVSRPLHVARTELAVEGVRLNEEAFVLDDGSPMLGVVTTPAESTFDDSWIVFIPNRYARRSGPNRLYAQWARSWAAAGAPSLRVDVNGTGDAGGPDEETDRDMYRQEAVGDVLRSLSYLRERFGARRFAVVGLCSGGYLGFHAALTDPSVEDVILLNPQMLLWTDQETAVTRAGILRERAFRLSSWKQVVAHPRELLGAVLPVAGEAFEANLRWRFAQLRRRNDNGAGGEHSVRSWIIDSVNQLVSRSCRLLFVFSEGDAGLGYLARHLGPDLTGLADRPTVTIDTVKGADHTFRQAGRQAALFALLQRHLASSGFSVWVDPSDRI